MPFEERNRDKESALTPRDKENSLASVNQPSSCPNEESDCDDPVASATEISRPFVTVWLPRLSSSWKGLIYFLSLTELFWVGAAAIWVNISYLLQVETSLTLLGLAVLFIPFLSRLCRGGYAAVRTPFDIPLALLVIGGTIGLWVSSQRGLSWGAFYSLLANTLGYYSVVNYRYAAALLKIGLSLGAVALLLATLFAFSSNDIPPDSFLKSVSWGRWLSEHFPQLPRPSIQPNLTIGASHGLALLLVIAAALCASLAVFARRAWLRVITGFGSMLFFNIMVLFSNASLIRLFTWESIKSRLPLWHKTLDLLQQSWFTGNGPGMFASLNNSSVYPPYGATHPHNAYLQLYSDTGVLGVLSLLIYLGVAVGLGWQMLRAPRASPWYGLGIGMLFALLASALVGMVESAPAGIPVVGTEAYFYIFSPIPWLLSVILVLTHRLLRKERESLTQV